MLSIWLDTLQPSIKFYRSYVAKKNIFDLSSCLCFLETHFMTFPERIINAISLRRIEDYPGVNRKEIVQTKILKLFSETLSSLLFHVLLIHLIAISSEHVWFESFYSTNIPKFILSIPKNKKKKKKREYLILSASCHCCWLFFLVLLLKKLFSSL